MLFIKVDNEIILECSIINNTVVVRIGDNNISPFYRTYKTDYLTVDCLINELLTFTNNLVISDNIYDVMGDL